MTQTPASGPLAPVTTPPRSLSPIRTASAVVGCAPSGVVAEAKTTATAIVAAELQPRFVIIALLPFSSAARGRIYLTLFPGAEGQSAAGCIVYSASLTCSAQAVP